MKNTTGQQSQQLARFLIDKSYLNKINSDSVSVAQTSSSLGPPLPSEEYFEFDKVFLGKPLEKYYVIPYNLSKLTFFIFIQVNQDFRLSLLKQIDEILAPHMLAFLHEIVEQQMRRNLIRFWTPKFEIFFSCVVNLFCIFQVRKKKKSDTFISIDSIWLKSPHSATQRIRPNILLI